MEMSYFKTDEFKESLEYIKEDLELNIENLGSIQGILFTLNSSEIYDKYELLCILYLSYLKIKDKKETDEIRLIKEKYKLYLMELSLKEETLRKYIN